MWVTPNDPSVDKFDARVHSQNNWEWQLYISPICHFGTLASIQLDRRRQHPGNKARCPGRGQNFCKIREKPNLLVNRKCCCCTSPILISSLIPFCSNNPYSEPDADNSPNNDTDWDWGGGKASPCGSPGPNVDPDHQNAALTKTVLTGEDNAISEWIFLIFPFLPFDFLTKRP